MSIHAIRRTFSFNLHKLGVPTATISLMLGHTEKVNEGFYDYDVTNPDEQLEYVEKVIQNT